MKQDTKDFIKRTAGTSALVASPGILAGTLIAGPLGGLAVGGAVTAGNVLGSLAIKKAKDIREDIENRRKFRELQKHILAQNGVLYYQPMVPAPFVATGDMACGKDMSLSREQKKEIKDYANSKAVELAKGNIDKIASASAQPALARISQLTSKSKYKDLSCLDRVLHKDFNLTPAVGMAVYQVAKNTGATEALKNTKLGRGAVATKNFVSNATRGIFTRPGHEFSEDTLLSVDEEELKHMRDDIEFTSDPSEKELRKSRYLSMLNEISRDRLEELLDEGKPKEEKECVACEPPVSMFSESPNLQTIAKGVDFGILSVLSSGIGSLFGKAKIAGNIAKNTKALTKATANATKAAEAAGTGGWLGKIATGIGKTAGKVKAGFTGETIGKAAENVAEGATKAAEAGAKVAEKASEGAEKLIDAGKKAADEATKVTTKLSEIQKRVNEGGVMNKFELKGVQMAGNSQLAASLGEKIGYENLGRGMKAIKTAGATQTAEQIQKEQAKKQQTA